MSRQQTNNPVYAEIVEANDERTIAALVLFDKRITREFKGGTHLADARGWVAGWNAHFEHEWDVVRDTTATIVDMFAAGLKRHGVSGGVINATLKEIAINGQ